MSVDVQCSIALFIIYIHIVMSFSITRLTFNRGKFCGPDCISRSKHFFAAIYSLLSAAIKLDF